MDILLDILLKPPQPLMGLFLEENDGFEPQNMFLNFLHFFKCASTAALILELHLYLRTDEKSGKKLM